MAQYTSFEDFPSLNFNPPPPTFAAPPPHAQNTAMGASHEVLHGQPISRFAATQPPAFQTSAAARDERLYSALEGMIHRLYENQLKLLESMQKILSNQAKLEETANATSAAVSKPSEDFNSWVGEMERSVDTDARMRETAVRVKTRETDTRMLLTLTISCPSLTKL
jgi:hypothetical protein